MFTDQFLIISRFGHEITLWFLFFLSIVSVAVLLERFFFLRQWKKASGSACKEIKQAIESGQPEWIKSLQLPFSDIDKNSNTQFLSLYMEKNSQLVPQVFRSFISFQKVRLSARLSLLATIGSNAPFVGLLGTIFGVMEAFNALGVDSGSSALLLCWGFPKLCWPPPWGCWSPSLLFQLTIISENKFKSFYKIWRILKKGIKYTFNL